jgi:hypothetical protein
MHVHRLDLIVTRFRISPRASSTPGFAELFVSSHLADGLLVGDVLLAAIRRHNVTDSQRVLDRPEAADSEQFSGDPSRVRQAHESIDS